MDPNAQNQKSINKPTMNPNAPTFHPTNPFVELNHFDLAMQPRVSVPPSEANSELPMIGRFNGSILPENYDRGPAQNRAQEQPTQQENNGRMPSLIQALWNERLFVTHFLALIVAFAHLVVFIIVALNS